MRAGTPNLRAAAASSGWIERSSLPPKPPPTADGHDPHPRRVEPEHPGELVAVQVRCLRAGEHRQPLGAGFAAATAPTRPRARCTHARRRRCAVRCARCGRRRRSRRRRRRDARARGTGRCPASARAPRARPLPSDCSGSRNATVSLPADRHLLRIDRLERVARTDQHQHRFSAHARTKPFGDRRLVAQVGKDREAVVRDVGGGDARRRRPVGARRTRRGRRVRSARAAIRRTNDAQPQRLRPAPRRRRSARCRRPWRRRPGAAAARRPPRRRAARRARPSARRPAPRAPPRRSSVAGAPAQHAADAVAAPARRSAAGGARSVSAAAISMPGVQIPHCAAPCATKACCTSARRCRRVALGRRLVARKPLVTRESLDRAHLAALALPDRDQAGAHLLAVEQHRAGAAVACVAADLGAGQPERRRAARSDSRVAGGTRQRAATGR